VAVGIAVALLLVDAIVNAQFGLALFAGTALNQGGTNL